MARVTDHRIKSPDNLAAAWCPHCNGHTDCKNGTYECQDCGFAFAAYCLDGELMAIGINGGTYSLD